ncbi:hypothetical protein [Chitinimonas sp. JJ19]|uniref:hypothetical protein n=1 Tax=Chitinimonas sp. JJ19 TaxID=3109352 RepID=UPI001A619C2A|nr:matrixin family metalloprotease [Chitinimonas sp.]
MSRLPTLAARQLQPLLWLACALAAWAESGPAVPGPAVLLQPMGRIAPQHVESVRQAISQVYGFAVAVGKTQGLPQAAYYPARQRYRADRLLDYLAQQRAGNGPIILALTDADISTTLHGKPDWGVFGLGSLDRKVAVASTYRLKRGASAAQQQLRLSKVAVHEIAHNLGLPHCSSALCVLTDMEGSISKLDAAPLAFCGVSRLLVQGLSYAKTRVGTP